MSFPSLSFLFEQMFHFLPISARCRNKQRNFTSLQLIIAKIEEKKNILLIHKNKRKYGASKKKSHRNKRKKQQWEKKKVYKRRQRRRYFSVYINKLKNLRRKKVCKFLWEGRIAQHWKKKFSIIHNIVAVLPANNTRI